jgi:quinol monooxygenase YgiN
MVVVNVKVDWGQETIQEIIHELKRHVEITLEEPGCDDFLFAIDINNPDIVVATEVYKSYEAHQDHFKTDQWDRFSALMAKYPPRAIETNTYEASEILHALAD